MINEKKSKELIKLEKKKSFYLQRKLRKINGLNMSINKSIEISDADKLIKKIN